MPQREPHQSFLKELDLLKELAQEWLRLFPQGASQGEHWLKVLSQVRAHLAEDTCRLAVVGTVKAGKSTVINALMGQDLLKRGAGILTAMITRVQPGPAAQAVLKFKDWAEINGEIHRALSLLPSGSLKERTAPLDLRFTEDRALLTQVLNEARSEDLWAEGSLDQNYFLLKSYLDGYELLQDLLPASGVLSLTGSELSRHRELVTREATAVYLKDVLLTIPFPWPAQGVELGDCQGSDSPIPQHLAQVLAYLIKCDLVLYVISSRVGLRQADSLFLGELKRLGLIPHILTLVNLDLGEHGSLYEVVRLRERVRQELLPWQPAPRLYAFSALKLLLQRRRVKEALDPREEALLQVWLLDPEAVAFSDQEADRFETDLKSALKDLKDRRLAGGSLAQVQMVVRGLREQLELTEILLSRDLEALQALESRLAARRQPLEATLVSLRQTLEGAGHHLKKVLKNRVTSQMGRRSGQLGASLLEFIKSYEPDWDRLVPDGPPVSSRPALYQLFQEFVQAVTRYVTQELNVSLVEFIRGQEEWLRQELVQVESPLLLVLQEGLILYYREIEALGFTAQPPTLKMAANPRPPGLEVPLLTLQVDPGWRWATEVWVRSGMGSLGRAWDAVKRRLGLKGETDPRRQLLRDLGRGLAAIKDWLSEEIMVQLLDYEERLKFRYFLPLVDQWLKHQEDTLADNLKSLCAHLNGVAGTMQLEETERTRRQQRLAELTPLAREIERRLFGGGGQGPAAPSPQINPTQRYPSHGQ